MFDQSSSSRSSATASIESVPWKDKYPSLTLSVREIQIHDRESMSENARTALCCWGDKDSGYRFVSIHATNGAVFEALTHSSLRGLLVAPETYTFWYDVVSHGLGLYRFKFTEILCVNQCN